MRSSGLLDQHQPGAPTSSVLISVLWQHPDSREIVPIGRLSRGDDVFVFDYTRAAAAVPDLRPLPGLPRLSDRYVSEHLPAVSRTCHGSLAP